MMNESCENTSVRTPDFPETADIVSSSDEYATRFSGPAGQWMLDVQEQITLDLVKKVSVRTILDVGGGHGQLAVPLCREGYEMTVLSSAEICKKRISDIVDSGKCRFVVGNVVSLPFQDKSFDAAISFRMVTHCLQWPALIKELCRVAKHSVVVDYPTSQSVNMIAPGLFNLKKKVEHNTRHWALFKHTQIIREFEKNGFTAAFRTGQFFLPMVLHRMLKNRAFSAMLEKTCRAAGLTQRWGSPVILRADRL